MKGLFGWRTDAPQEGEIIEIDFGSDRYCIGFYLDGVFRSYMGGQLECIRWRRMMTTYTGQDV